jgi:hypothetical protein
MDITMLMIGQNVCMASGPYFCQGRVVKVTLESVEVWVYPGELGPEKNGMLVKFDKDDKECTFDKQKFPNAWMGTYESGPWELTNGKEKKEAS